MKFFNDIKNRGVFFFLICIGLLLMLIGTTFNFLVITENQGRMPVQGCCFDSDKHFTFNDKEEINYYYLADIFKIKRLLFSIGDLLIVLAIISVFSLLIFQAIMDNRKKRNTAKEKQKENKKFPYKKRRPK